MAVCTEFTSLILLRFVEERARGRAPRQAMTVTAARTGRAFMVSGMTVVAGIGVIATSSMPMLRDFGLIVAMNVAVALLSALVDRPTPSLSGPTSVAAGCWWADQAQARAHRVRQAGVARRGATPPPPPPHSPSGWTFPPLSTSTSSSHSGGGRAR